jgi:hypothetical protein
MTKTTILTTSQGLSLLCHTPRPHRCPPKRRHLPMTGACGKTGDERDVKRMRKIRQFRRRTGEDRWYPKALVICLSSLISNWESEFKTWGWWNVYVYHGSKEDKEMALQAAKKGSLKIMITNYKTYHLRHQDVNMVEWDCVIADKCHKIKERSSETTERMNEINALCRISLQGKSNTSKDKRNRIKEVLPPCWIHNPNICFPTRQHNKGPKQTTHPSTSMRRTFAPDTAPCQGPFASAQSDSQYP